MTSTQTLLYAAASDVTLARVRALVQQVGPESPTVEYKEKLADTVARGVAALANTYGGIMLIGVTDNRKIVGVKESVIASVAEHCAAKIGPPYVPDIIPVPLNDGSGLVTLVLRVIPGHHPRPLLVGGIAYVRHQNTTHPADWQRLADLFSAGTAAQQGDPVWDIRRPDLPVAREGGGSDPKVDIIMRSGLNVAIAREAKWRPLSERNVAALAQALDRSPFSRALTHIALPTGEGGIDGYRRLGFNRARSVRLEWSAAPAGWPDDAPRPVKACSSLEVPGAYGNASTHLTLHLEGQVQLTAAADYDRARSTEQGINVQLPQWRVSVPQLCKLVDALLATLTNEQAIAPIAELAGVDVAAVPQPRVLHLVTARPITEVLFLDGLRPIPGAGVSHGAHLLGDPALDLADAADRAAQVRMWLTQASLDAGLLGMEHVLDQVEATAG